MAGHAPGTPTFFKGLSPLHPQASNSGSASYGSSRPGHNGLDTTVKKQAMKWKLVFVWIWVGALSSINAFAQDALPFHEYRLLAQLQDEVLVHATQDGSIAIENAELDAVLLEFDLQRVVPCSKALLPKAGQSKNYTAPIAMQFGRKIVPVELSKELMETGLFKFVEPDYVVSAGGICATEPNDAHYSSRQWSHNNTGTFDIYSEEDADIDMDQAWEITTGNSKVKVAILDTGIDPNSIELRGRFWDNPNETDNNGKDDDANGYIDDGMGWDFIQDDNDPFDDNGHGTNVTGIVAANGNNKVGYAGVDWKCQLMIVKVLDLNSRGFNSDIAQGMFYAVNNGADVINMSLGSDVPSSSIRAAVEHAYKNDVAIVASMGNKNNDVPQYPAAFDNVIAVGATDTDNERVAPFTWGGGSNYGDHIDISAPGNYIYGLSLNNNYDTYWGGTSQAAPLVTGVIALLKGLDNTLSIDSIEGLLIQGATDLVGRPSEDKPGWDAYHGHGVLNAYKTLLLAQAKNIEACNGYEIGGTYYDSSVLVYDTMATPSGCEEVSVTRLSIKYSPERVHAISTCDSLKWIDGKVYRKVPAEPVRHFVANPNGCDSVQILDLKIKKSSTTTQVVTACNSFTWENGETYVKSDSTISYVLTNQVGCDSIISLYLTVHETDREVIEEDGKLRAFQANADYQWLDCDEGNIPIAGKTSQEWAPTSSGNYAVVVELGECLDTSNCHNFIHASLPGTQQALVEVYPNPFSDGFKITVRDGNGPLQFRLVNSLGQLVVESPLLENTDPSFLLAHEPAGLYYLQVSSTKGREATYQLVKTK